MTIWLVSDTHFQHVNLMDLTARPFTPETVADHDVWLISIWNDRVKPGDTVWHLGDFAMGLKVNHQSIFDQLNGTIHLIRGNHDGNNINKPYTVVDGFASVRDCYMLKADGARVWLNHYPILSWPNQQRGVSHAHGHTHGQLIGPVTKRLDVGVDAVAAWAGPEWAHGPVPLDVFLSAIDERPLAPVDYHN